MAYRPKAMDCEIKERRTCGHDRADGKFYSKELKTIRDTAGNGTANQSHCRRRTEHDPEFFWSEPASRKKGRQERRGSSECTEKCGVEHYKSKQYAAVGGHDLQVQPWGRPKTSMHLKHSRNVRYATESSHGALAGKSLTAPNCPLRA
jgi:hypothetical protein